jgi:hypothetical protein
MQASGHRLSTWFLSIGHWLIVLVIVALILGFGSCDLGADLGHERALQGRRARGAGESPAMLPSREIAVTTPRRRSP